ncbi:ATP-binding protein [bacterium]|nr:ATP-binding protein [bacterium]
MFQRECKLPEKVSFFLFGARGTGKSTLLKNVLRVHPAAYIDLLKVATERELAREPDSLEARVRALPEGVNTVVIDEIQRLPRLLDVVHRLIETPDINVRFALTGSSARKLKAGGANLLAGRAFLRNIFPLTQTELGEQFTLEHALSWGTLPALFKFPAEADKVEYLEAYAHAYLKEEIWGEQVIRNLDPFRRFLEVAASQNGTIVNTSKIARDVGADYKTVQNYYSILEDTLLGFHLDAFDTSVRKRLRRAPKFYFFDCGVARSLANQLSLKLHQGTSYYGQIFEQFVINEIMRRNVYERKNFKLTYLCTEAGVEVDLVLELPGKPLIFVEIKSKQTVLEDDVSSLSNFVKDFANSKFFCLSRDTTPKKWGKILALHWREGLDAIFEV